MANKQGMGDNDSFGLFSQRRNTQDNVNRSIGLLNDSLATPGFNFGQRTNPTPKTPYKHSSFVPKPMPSASKFDVNNTYGLFTSSSMSLLNTPSNRTSMMNTSLFATPSSVTRPGTQICEDMTMIGSNLTFDEDPGVAACRSIFADFLESYRRGGAEETSSKFERVARYETICRDNVALLRELTKRSIPGHGKYARTSEMLDMLRLEQDSWGLVGALYQDRVNTDSQILDAGDECMAVDGMSHATEKQIMESLYARDAVVRQAQFVVDWLESNEEELLEDFYNKVDYSVDKMGSWENTLHSLKQQRATSQVTTHRTVVTELDPDAPLRQQGRHLMDLDVEDDSRLLDYMFCCIRAGQIERAHQVCLKIGHVWWAATLEGWRLYHDPNVEALGPGGTVQKVEGNPYRDIWKLAAWKAADEERLSVVERAMYATLSGNLRQLLPNCKSWYDYVWAYFRVMVDQRVDEHIHSVFNGPRLLLQLPQSYMEKSYTAHSIFSELQACPIEVVQRQSKNQYHVIQKYIILNDVDSLIEQMYAWCKDGACRPHQHTLRFMAHLVLFLRALDVTSTTKEMLCMSIVEAYIRLLIDEKYVDLVATYVATLPRHGQVEWYAKFLEGIHGTDERRRCLELAEDAGLDVQRITKLVVENIRNIDSSDLGPDSDIGLGAATTDEDRQKIEALEWLVFDPAQRSEALRQANAVMRVFLCLRKLAACRDAFNILPKDTFERIHRPQRIEDGECVLDADDDNSVREYLCVQAYLDAHDSFTDWFQHMYNAKPSKPEVAYGATFAERVAFEHQQRQYDIELGRWQHSLDVQTNATVQKIYNVLLFIDGGWMVDRRTDCAVDERRSREMELLRQTCLPMMCTLLHKVLQSTARYQEFTQIADLIASEEHQLYKVFRPDELQKLLMQVRESSVALLDMGHDPLGYPLN